MRDGILEHLPQALASDRTVLVVLNEDKTPGFKGVRSMVDRLNRRQKWIKFETRDVDSNQVSSDVAVVLPMYTVKSGTLANLKRVASSQGFAIPASALSVGEVKNIIQTLADRRSVLTDVLPQSKSKVDGNGKHEETVEKEETKKGADQVSTATPSPDQTSNSSATTQEGEKVPEREEKEEVKEPADVFAVVETFGQASRQFSDVLLDYAARLDTAKQEVQKLTEERDDALREVERLKTELSSDNRHTKEIEELK